MNFKRFLPDVVCVALFVAISFLYFMDATLDGRRLDGHDHSAADGLSVEMDAYRDAHDGETPRWTNSIFGGMPTYQIAPSYDSQKPIRVIEEAYHLWLPDYVYYVLISLLGFYILLRAFDFRQWMAALGAIVWAFSSYFFIIIAAGHLWKVFTLAYIPPTIAGVVLCYRGKYLWGGVLTAFFATLQILSNHVQMTYYFLIPEVLMVVGFLIDSIRTKRMAHFFKATGVLAVAAVIAVGINASNLYHTYEYSKDTMRGKSELVKQHKPGDQTDSGLERSYITNYSYEVGETWTLLIPNAKGGASAPLSMDKTAMKKADPQLQQMGVYNAFTQYWGGPEGTSGPVYVGALVCMLFVLGLILVPNANPLKWVLVASTVLSVMLAWGRNFMPLTDFFIDYIPMYAKFRAVESILVVAEFTIPLLAMLGLKEFVERTLALRANNNATAADYGRKLFKPLAISVAITAGLCLIFAVMPGAVFGECVSDRDISSVAQYVNNGYFDQSTGNRILASLSAMREAMLTADAWRSLFIIMLGAVLMYVYSRKGGALRTGILVGGLLVICLVDMWQVNKRYLNDQMFVHPRGVEGIAKTDADKYILEKSGTGRDYRVLNLTVSTFNDNTTSAFYSSVGGYHAAKLRRYQELIEAHISPEVPKIYDALQSAPLDTLQMIAESSKYPIYDLSAVNTDALYPVLNMLNTRWFILGAGEGGRVKLPVENTAAYGNAWFVKDVKYVSNANEELDALGDVSPRYTAVVDKSFKTALGGVETLQYDEADKIVQTELTSTSVKYDVESKNGGLVVFSEIYYPGWKATIDGEAAEIGRADYVLRAMNVPAGKHVIEMVYDPQSLHTTEAIATTALVLLIVGFVVALLKNKIMSLVKKTSKASAVIALLLCFAATTEVKAQSHLYPQHFDLQEVELLDSPFKSAMHTNAELLLRYDAERLMTPFIRQAGLDKAGSKYRGWIAAHPSFSNWGLSDWSLEGHVGGHYLTALAQAYAAVRDADLRARLKERLDYCVAIMKDCQEAYDANTQGLYGFIGGQPINQIWTGLYANNLSEFQRYGGWVPFYCQHKVIAGMRDAWVYAGNEDAKECFRKISDWSVNVISKLSYNDMQNVLGWEHGGMNEAIADAYHIFGDKKYLDAAKRYNHAHEVNGMQGSLSSYSRTFLNGQHANTQVPKFIGFQRITELESGNTNLETAAENFWDDVATNRTVCIGGNSVSEHFLAADRCSQYMTNLDGPESCNSNNMLKLSELMFNDTHDAKYVDFYEQTMWNHILSTQNPKTGGYVYFTSLRPQSYRVYSQVNQGMWCCVGTGMENHSKYGHFIYTHDEAKTLYVNLFTASVLNSDSFGVRQETNFPFEQQTRLTMTKSGAFTLALRHPSWVGKDFKVKVNGEEQAVSVTEGKASYVSIDRSWSKGDVVTVDLPMSVRYEECPNYGDYIAFKYGPILLAAKTTAATAEEENQTGLYYEKLQNEYAGEGRMDHAPGVVASLKPLSSASLLIGERKDVLSRITPIDLTKLRFSIDCRKDVSSPLSADDQTLGVQKQLVLEPFYGIHHARYSCYWYQQTAENYANSNMGKRDAEEQAILERTLDFVATGEQQSEAGHMAKYSSGSTSGSFRGETYRDARAGEFIQYVLANPKGLTENVSVMCRFIVNDKGRKGTIYIDGEKIADVTVPESHKKSDENGFYNEEYLIPTHLLVNADGTPKESVTFKIVASSSTMCPGLFYLRLLSDYKDNAYSFRASEWVTGDAGRVSQSNITYDTDANTITVKAGTGANNVCLSLDYAKCDYTVTSQQKYLVVRGTNLSTSGGASYLWWLNGMNRGTSVAPTIVKTITVKEPLANDPDKKISRRYTVIAWDMTQSGIADNNVGEKFNICNGLTIFGLTSTSGTSVIKHIGFETSVDEYMETVDIAGVKTPSKVVDVYNLQGVKLRSSVKVAEATQGLPKGMYVVGNQVVVK